MQRKNNTLSLSKYLRTYERINKFNLLSIHKEPTINKINFHMSLKQFLSASYAFGKKEINQTIQIQASMFFYILFHYFPKIDFQSIKMTKASKIRNDGDFILKFSMSNKNYMDDFIKDLLLENSVVLKSNKKINDLKNIETTKSKTLSYNFELPGNLFFDINEFFYTKNQDINLPKISIIVSFLYINIPKNIKSVSTLKNLLTISV